MDKDKKSIEWLFRQLPEWVEKGILPQDRADALRAHYQNAEEGSGSSRLLTLFAIMGMALIGLGVILILAHNWEQFSRMQRLVLLLGQLFAAQLFAAYALWRRPDSIAWCEGSGVLLALLLGASLALIGQTYHVAAEMGSFLLLWMLLVLPIVYLLRAVLPALIYLGGSMAWLFVGVDYPGEKQWIWLLLALLGPYYWQRLQAERYGEQAVILSWSLLLCFYVSFVEIFQRYISELDFLIYGALFAATYLIGRCWFDEDVSVWKKAHKLVGGGAVLALSIALTFQEVWHNEKWQASGQEEQWLAGMLLLLLAVLLWQSFRKERGAWALGLQPLLVAGGLFLAQASGSWASALLFNVYALLIGIRTLVQGVKRNSFARLNAGMLLVAGLILVRFFDLNYSYVFRGSVFVSVGGAFLLVNAWLARRKGKVIK